jgi:hypothetical protein
VGGAYSCGDRRRVGRWSAQIISTPKSLVAWSRYYNGSLSSKECDPLLTQIYPRIVNIKLCILAGAGNLFPADSMKKEFLNEPY